MTNQNDFYQKHDYVYPEMAICLEDIYKKYISMEIISTVEIHGKFFIPTLTPFLDNGRPYDRYDASSGCTLSNYINIRIPVVLFDTVYIEKGFYIIDIKKGDKFAVFFIGGDINKPYITGRYKR